jgi:hypothetical protein
VFAGATLPKNPDLWSVYEVDWIFDWGEGPQKAPVKYLLKPEGQVVEVLGRRFRLKPGADPTQLDVSIETQKTDP